MSSTLKPQTLGRRLDDDGQDRSVMLSRLGIVEAKPAEPEPEVTQVEALAAPPPALVEESPVLTPALDRLRALVSSPANDVRVDPTAAPPAAAAPVEQAAFAIPTPPAAAAAVEEEEDPFEAIRQRYRNPPKPGLAIAPGITLPSSIPLPTSIPIPELPKIVAPIGERRRKAGELSTVRKIIWTLSVLAALSIGWALLKADESSPIIQVLNGVLP